MQQEWSPVDLTDPLVVTEAFERQPLIRAFFGPIPARAKLPFIASPAVSIMTLASSLDRPAHQLLFVLRRHGGRLRLVDARAEAGDLPDELLDRAARDLIVTGLAKKAGAWLELNPILDGMLQLPVPLFSEWADRIKSEDLAKACSGLHLSTGTRKAERIETLRSFLSDKDAVLAAIEGLAPECVEIFGTLLQRTLDRQPSSATLAGAHATREFLPFEARRRYLNAASGLSSSPLDRLSRLQLIGSTWDLSEVWIWAETVYAVTGRMFPEWPAPEVPELRPLERDDTSSIADLLHTVTEILAAMTATPAVGNKTGERRPPVKFWRGVAKASDIDPELVIRAGSLVIELGLIVPVFGPKQGRGRKAVNECVWRPEPSKVATWAELPASQQWAHLVTGWLDPDLEDAPTTRDVRRLVIDLLWRLPAGMGVPAATFARWAQCSHVALAYDTNLDDVIGDLVRIGMVTPGPVIGLNTAARSLGDPKLSEVLDGVGVTATVQADHTIVAPADLSVAALIGLRRIADTVSSGGVTVLRLSADKIAMAGTDHRFDPVEFLRTLADRELPAAVERFMTDSINAANPISVRTVGCVITTDDHALLTTAARHKAAQLEIVAPGVAVSPLTETKVTETLRSKGIVMGRSAGVVPTKAKLAPNWQVAYREPSEPLPRSSNLFGPSAESLAEQVLSRPPDPPPQPPKDRLL